MMIQKTIKVEEEEETVEQSNTRGLNVWVASRLRSRTHTI